MNLDLASIGQILAFIIGPGGIIAAVVMWRKNKSESGKTDAETRRVDWEQWESENKYLREQMADLRERVVVLETEARDCREREAELKAQNTRLTALATAIEAREK